MEIKTPKILYIDDDMSNIVGFKATFRSSYFVVGVTNVNDAKKALEEHEFQVIIADQRMPEMSGIDFFESILEIYSDPIRVLMTGYADIKDTIDAINRGQIFRYLNKPWKEEEVALVLNNACELYKQRKENYSINLELQKAYNELNKFVYSASHDMRAPLMSILGIIKVAKMENIDDQAKHYFDLIETSVNKLSTFNSNLIDYYTNSKEEKRNEKIDFTNFCTDILSNFKYYPNFENIEFRIHVDQHNPFFGDNFRLRIIINNLLTNAIKFHLEEGTDLYVKIHIESDSEKAVIKIEDNGKGIEEEHLNRIFDMFYRAIRKNSGSGIGLYIVKEAVEKLNGTIEVTSKLEQGTSFILTIPNQSE